ncbi:MAG: hypothetical protein ACXWKA_01120 [Xanthobacteraceae bacterium]
MPWSSYDGKRIQFQQSKTKRRVVIPVGGPLKAELDGANRIGPLILTNQSGQPWTSDGFRTMSSKARAAVKISGLTFHDLRGSAVVRLALAEATVPQIATFTGHSPKASRRSSTRTILAATLRSPNRRS